MDKQVKVIIAGTRTFKDYNLLCKIMKIIRQYYPNIKIILGGCKGADKCGELYALENKIPYEVYEANWKKYGKRAGPLRNEEMAKVGEVLVLLWDCESRGSKDMLHLAIQYGLRCYVMDYVSNTFYTGKNILERIWDDNIPF